MDLIAQSTTIFVVTAIRMGHIYYYPYYNKDAGQDASMLISWFGSYVDLWRKSLYGCFCHVSQYEQQQWTLLTLQHEKFA